MATETSPLMSIEEGSPRTAEEFESRSPIKRFMLDAFPLLKPGWWPIARKHLTTTEFAGALGDMGTFLPTITLLAEKNHLDFSSMLFFAGIANLIAGVAYEAPIPVQPMHAISAIALTQNLTPNEVLAAGMCVGCIVLVLGLTNLIRFVNAVIPLCVVRGLQLSLGVQLVTSAYSMIFPKLPWIGWDSILLAIISMLFIFYTSNRPRIPGALILFFVGLIIAISTNEKARHFTFGLGPISIANFTWNDIKRGFLIAAVPQIPVTVMNSVIALSKLNNDLYPEKPLSLVKITWTIAAIDVVLPWFGACPSCHGAGGLASQHAFGARTNISMLALGFAKILCALLFGSSLLSLVSVYPASILGCMLAYSGLMLGSCARDIHEKDEALTMVFTTGCCIAFNNTAIGVGLGVVCFVMLHIDMVYSRIQERFNLH